MICLIIMVVGNGQVAQELIVILNLESLILNFKVKSLIKIVFISKNGCLNLKIVIILIFMTGKMDIIFMLSKLYYKIISLLLIMNFKKIMF